MVVARIDDGIETRNRSWQARIIPYRSRRQGY